MALDTAAMILRIRGDSSDAVKSVQDFKKELKELEGAQKGALTPLQQLGAESGVTASQFSNLKVGALAAVAGVTAIVAAATTAGIALFNLAKNTADYAGSILDASQQTKTSTDTMQALKFAAEQSGSSFEGVTNAVAKFNVLLGNAAAGNDKAEKILKQYGITAKDTDGALVQAISTIAEMTSGSDQAAAAAALFKDRTGEILPVIQSFKGDLPGLIEELRDLGLIMSKDAVEAGDQFGDQMDVLNKQLAGVGRTIGVEVIPVFMEMARNISDWLKENPGQVKAWGETFAYALRRVGAGIEEITINWEALKDSWNTLETTPEFLERVRQREAALQRIKNIVAGTDIRGGGGAFGQPDDRFVGGLVPAPFNPRALVDEEERKKAADEAKKAAEKAQKEAEALRKRQLQGQLGQIDAIQAAEQHALERITASLKAEFDARAITASEYLDRRLHDEEEYAKGAIEDIEREFALRRKQEKLSSEQLKALKLEEDLALQKVVDQRYEREEKAKKEAASQEKKLSKEQLEAAKDDMERRVALYEATGNKIYAVAVANAKKEETTAEELAKLKQAIDERVLNYRIDLLKKYADKLGKGGKEYLDLQNKIKVLEQELEELRAKNHTADQKRHDDRLKSWQKYLDKLKETTEAEDERQEKRAQDEIKAAKKRDQKTFDEIGGGILGGIFGELGLSVEEMADPMNIMNDLGQMLASTFSQLSSAVGEAVRAFVLFGSAGGSLKKFAAEMLATIAQMAAVQALWEMAQWAAMTALFWFTGNPAYALAAGAHLTAAIIYGSIAAVAALAGRAVAGDSFKKQTATGGATGSNRQASTSREGGAYSGEEDQTIEMGINRPMVQGELKIKLELDDEGMLRVAQRNISRNGGWRNLIVETVGGA